MTKKDELKRAIEAVEAARELVDNLKENLQESVDHMSGTNLEHTERYQKYEQAAFELDDIVSELEDLGYRLEGVEL